MCMICLSFLSLRVSIESGELSTIMACRATLPAWPYTSHSGPCSSLDSAYQRTPHAGQGMCWDHSRGCCSMSQLEAEAALVLMLVVVIGKTDIP